MAEAIRQGDIPGVQIRVRKELPLSAAHAWRWLVEPDRLGSWLAERAEVEGEDLLLECEREGKRVVERGKTEELDPPHRWVLAFWLEEAGWEVATRLTLALRPHPGGCELDILQENFQLLPLSTCLTHWEEYRRRWRDALAALARAVADEASGHGSEV